MKKILMFLIVLSLTHVRAQTNIVPNPSFETFTSCPQGPDEWYRCSSWISAYTPTTISGTCGSPDYYNASCTNVAGWTEPAGTINGTVSVHTGNGMMGLCPYSKYVPQYREYITAPLTCTMVPNVTYTVSFWSRLASPTQNSMTVKYIGVYLSSAAPTQTCGEQLTMTPQFETSSNSDINTTWQQFSFVITPSSNLNYITLGSFKTDFQNNLTPYAGYTGAFSSAYYFFDDIAVLTPTTPFTLGTNIIQSGCNNSPVNSATVIPSNPNYSYTYAWSPGGYTTPSVSNLTPGVYTVSVMAANGCTTITHSIQFTMNPVPPNPTITINASPYCIGHSATLTATGASTFVWQPGGTVSNSIVVSPTVSTTYTVTGTNIYGCVSSATYILGPPQPNPTVSISLLNPTRCVGTSATLTAAGASTYVWQPGAWSGNPYVVNPASPTIYTVTGTSAAGCTATAVYTLAAALPNPTVTISASSTIACAGYPATLTASGADTYYWYPIGSTSNPITVNPAGPTVYYVFGSYTTGCQSSATITITNGQVVDVSVRDTTFCNNAVPGVSISATSTFVAGPVIYTWQWIDPTTGLPVTASGQTIFTSPSSTTIYTVTASSPLGCPTSNTMAVTVTTNCCSQSTTGLTPLAGAIAGPYAGTSYFVAANILLSGNTSFQNSEVLLMPGVQIIVPSGIQLDLETTHLYACGINMWQGIVVQDGGQVITSNTSSGSSMIEDAVIAIDVDNITTSCASPPVMIDNLLFNKNYIGVQFSNSTSGVTTLPVGMSECVFASRSMPFTAYPSPLSWPNTYNTTGGLRYPYSPTATQGLTPPFLLLGYSQANLKQPYASQSSHFGIKIDNIGVVVGTAPATGVDIGFTYASGLNQFNLFDGLDVGIDVTDASLSTMNNVFQSSGKGINHTISGIMNAGLNLVPTTASTDYGNRFWNCAIGIETYDVYQINDQYSTFRADIPAGKIGMLLESNRFAYDIEQCEYNDLDQGIIINTLNGLYNFGGKTLSGVYAGNMVINQNYFGPEVTSSAPIGSEDLNYAITINGASSGSWQMTGGASLFSNKIDRAFRGIRVNQMNAYPTDIGGNSILIYDDNSVAPGQDQYGIYVNDSKDNLIIDQNVVTGQGTGYPFLKMIRSVNNISNSGIQSPVVTCNQVYEGYIGFEFEGPQPNTTWTGNYMYQKMHIGLSLRNNGQIGTQGTPVVPCADKWFNNGYAAPNDWASNFETNVTASNAAPGSFLWCENSANTFPTTNGFVSGTPFAMPASLKLTRTGGDCLSPNTYPSLPTQRTMAPTGIKTNSASDWSADIYPNPSNGTISIRSSVDNETLCVRIMDLTGKIVYTKTVSNTTSGTIDLSSLKASVYFVEIQNNDNKTVRKKLIMTN